jgi:hypothetical protein
MVAPGQVWCDSEGRLGLIMSPSSNPAYSGFWCLEIEQGRYLWAPGAAILRDLHFVGVAYGTE